MALAPGHTSSHTSPEGKPGTHPQPWELAGTCCRRKARAGLRAEVLLGCSCHTSGDTWWHSSPRASWAQDSRAWEPHSKVEKQLPSRGQGTTAALGNSCFGHKDICPRDTDWDKLVPQSTSSLESLSWWLCKPPAKALSKKNELLNFFSPMGFIQTHYVLGFSMVFPVKTPKKK